MGLFRATVCNKPFDRSILDFLSSKTTANNHPLWGKTKFIYETIKYEKVQIRNKNKIGWNSDELKNGNLFWIFWWMSSKLTYSVFWTCQDSIYRFETV